MKVLDNGVLRNATQEEQDEITARANQPPPPPAESIPMLNLELVLIKDGHADKVDDLFSKMTGPAGKRARAFRAKALTAKRSNEWVNLLWPQLYANEAAFNAAWERAANMDPDDINSY